MPFEYGEYKGTKTLTVTSTDGKTRITFGGRKAQALAAEADEIRKFALESTYPARHQDATDRQYEDDCQQRTGA